MAKTIKFNLICDDHPVRNIEQLCEHFSIEDMLKYYKNGLFVRWLNVRGYAKEEELVKALSAESDLETVKELIKIFGIETDEKIVEENTIMIEYQDKERERAAKFAEQKMSKDSVIQEHFAEYQRLVDCIIEDKDNMAVCRAAIREIDKNYRDIFDMDYRRLFWLLIDKAPKAVFAMLMHDNMRAKYTASKNVNDDSTKMHLEIKKLFYTGDSTRKMYKRSDLTEVKRILGSDLIEHSSSWSDGSEEVISRSGKYLILQIGNQDKVYGYQKVDKKYEYKESEEYSDFWNEFVVLDGGFAYISKASENKLYYMVIEPPKKEEE
ncbi:MAG: hypothetical protein IJB55_02650 [Firmicutes bacterium]|nr:hypothetical protein [Bacillota bacterium]